MLSLESVSSTSLIRIPGFYKSSKGHLSTFVTSKYERNAAYRGSESNISGKAVEIRVVESEFSIDTIEGD